MIFFLRTSYISNVFLNDILLVTSADIYLIVYLAFTKEKGNEMKKHSTKTKTIVLTLIFIFI